MSLPLEMVVLAAFIHATWNLLAKRAGDGGPPFVLTYTAVNFVVYAPWTAWVITHHGTHMHGAGFACIICSGLIHIGYSLCLQRGYYLAPLAVVYPVARGCGPLLSTIGAVLILGEIPSPLRLGGLLAVVTGIWLISTQGRLAALREPGSLSGIRWGSVTGLFIAGYTVNDAYAVKTLGVHPVLLDWGSSLLRMVILGPLVLKDRRAAIARMRGRWLLAVGIGMLSPLAYILVLTALQMQLPLSVAAPMREMSMMVGALFGMLFLRESVGFWRIAGCLVLVGGVALLAGNA